KRNRLELMRRYPSEPNRLGVPETPRGLPRHELRLTVVEALISRLIEEICADPVGGPIAQALAPDGGVVQSQTFYTWLPHIVIERTDGYPADAPDPVEITWCLKRIQNQRAETRFNRLLDAANLAVDLIGVLRFR